MLSVLRAAMAFLLPHDIIIHAVHFLGRQNVVADTLSCLQALPTWLQEQGL